MKIFNLITFIFAIVFLQSCNRNEEISVQKITDTEKIQTIINSGIKGIPFPEGSTAYKLANNQTKITLPEDVYFVVKNQKGEVFRVRELGVRCTCSKGSGCSPASVKGQFFCVMNEDCKTCSSSPALIDDNLNKNSKMGQSVEIVGVMDENKTAFFHKTENNFLNTTKGFQQYGITKDFFQCKEVQELLTQIYSLSYDENLNQLLHQPVEPSQYLKQIEQKITKTEIIYTKVSLAGNNILIPIPKKSKEESPDLIFFTKNEVDEDFGTSICTCHKGKEGCVLGKMFGAKYCEADNCTDCSLK